MKDDIKIIKFKPLISIIIPLYNSDKYISECIDSVIGQTYSNLEIILVDDKSPDDSGKIADEYAKKDNRVKVIHKKVNEKSFQARKTGFDLMKGDYFMAVDGDDSIHPNFVSDMVEEAHKTNADIIFSKGMIMKFEDETKNFPITWPIGVNKNISVNYENYWKELATGNYPWGWSIWGKLYKFDIYREANPFLNNIKTHITMADDLLLFSILGFFANTKSISTKSFGYIYRQNEASSVHTNDVIRISNYINEVKLVFDELRKFVEEQSCGDNTIEYISKFEKVILSGHAFRLDEAKKYEEQPEIKFTGKKRILCPTVFGTMNGGGERSSYALWRWLNKYYDIVIALPKDANNDYINACKRDGINYVLCDYEHSVENGQMQFSFIKIIYDLKIDIVFPAMYLESALSAAAATNTPAVFLDYGLVGQLVTTCLNDEGYRSIFSKRMKMSNIIISNSLWGTGAVREFIDRKAIYAPSYTETPDITIKKGKTVRLIYPARIEHGKDQLSFVKAVKLLHDSGIKNEAIIMGNYEAKWTGMKEYYENIVAYIDNNKLDKQVKLTGWMKKPFSHFTDKDIYVSTTKSEAVGRATLEAVELGIPVLIPDIPGHREFKEIIGMSDEHFYEPGNLVDFKEKAEHLINHIDEAKKRAKKYAKIAQDKFSEENCNKDILSALHDIEGKGNPGVNFWADQQIELMRDYDERMQIINSLRSDVTDLNNQLSSFLSTKRAVKLAAGNFLRHIRRKINLLEKTQGD